MKEKIRRAWQRVGSAIFFLIVVIAVRGSEILEFFRTHHINKKS
ncbi:hypothetical protein [Komagataeibacter diospyri]